MGRNRANPTKDMIDSMHANDQHVGLLKPWTGVSQKPLDRDKDYLCVATWGTMHILNCPKFIWLTSKIGSELHGEIHGPHLIGETRQTSLWGVSDFRVETFTVWHDREEMAKFYQSGAHKHAMTSMRNDVDFRARRVFVKGSDIPKEGDSAAVRDFVKRIKSDDFREAPKKV